MNTTVSTIKTGASRAKNAVKGAAMSALVYGQYMLNNVAFADGGNSSKLMQTVIEWVAKLVVIPGVVLAIMGIIGFAQAHSEGDGPAQQKAIGKLAAAGMLVLLSIILNAAAPTLVGYISA